MSKIVKSFQVNLGKKFSVEAPSHVSIPHKHSDDDLIEQHNDNPNKQPWEIEAQNILNQATAMANDIISKAEQEAQAIRENAAEKGYNDGKAEYENLIAEAKLLKQNASDEYDNILNTAERDIIELVLKISAKILGDEVDIDRNRVVNIVAQALKKCTFSDSVIIRVSPQDYELLNNSRDMLKAYVAGTEDIQIRSEATFENGKCIIETQFGSVEAGVDVQLEQIRNAFEQLMR